MATNNFMAREADGARAKEGARAVIQEIIIIENVPPYNDKSLMS